SPMKRLFSCFDSSRHFSLGLLVLSLLSSGSLCAQTNVEQWGLFELALQGPTNDNPFVDVQFSARFSHEDTVIEATGFYDGDGIYRVRCMPPKQGRWRYQTRSSVPELNGRSGEFSATPPL